MKSLLLGFLALTTPSLEAMVKEIAQNEYLVKANAHFAANKFFLALDCYKRALKEAEPESEDYYSILSTMMSIYHNGSDSTAVKPDKAFKYANSLKDQTVGISLDQMGSHAILARTYLPEQSPLQIQRKLYSTPKKLRNLMMDGLMSKAQN